MASIKVTYGQTSRKFTTPSNITWSDFESQLHNLFNISNDIKISISYIDEDGDVITLSTDSELQQILSDQEYFGTIVKFNIYTSENIDNNDWVLENAEEKDDSVTTLSDEEETKKDDEASKKDDEASKKDDEVSNKDDESSNKDDESSKDDETSKNDEESSKNDEASKKDDDVVAYNFSEPNETEDAEDAEDAEDMEATENKEDSEDKEITDVQTEQQQPPVVEVKNYPSVTVTDEENDPLFVPTILSKEENQSDELLTPVHSVNKGKGKEQTPKTPVESSNNAETSSPNEKAKESNEDNEESEDDPFIFIISSSPWIQRTYYRPRVNLFNRPTHFSHFARPSRPRYSYIAPSYGYRRNPYFGPRNCGLGYRGFGGFDGFSGFNGFNGFSGFGGNRLYHFEL